MRERYCPLPEARAPLKLGQNSQRNIVPSREKDKSLHQNAYTLGSRESVRGGGGGGGFSEVS